MTGVTTTNKHTGRSLAVEVERELEGRAAAQDGKGEGAEVKLGDLAWVGAARGEGGKGESQALGGGGVGRCELRCRLGQQLLRD